MYRISPETLVELARRGSWPAASIYLQLEGAGPSARADKTAVRSAVQKARRELVAQGLVDKEAADLLDPVLELATSPGTWRDRGQGLALFAAPGWFRAFRLPAPVQSGTHVGRRFLTRQLLPLVGAEDRILVLAVSGRTARLIRIDGETVTELKDAGMPQGFDALPWQNEADRSLQFHGLGRGSSRGGRPVYHGQGGGEDTVKERLEEYLRFIDAKLKGLMQTPPELLVLAADAPVATAFRRLSSYSNVARRGVTGNPDEVGHNDLAARARLAAAADAKKAAADATARYDKLQGTGRGITGLGAVLPAAAAGRVLDLFVANEAVTWGRFDHESGIITVMRRGVAGADDLFDLAAQLTAVAGGSVHARPLGEMPGSQPRTAIAATLRF
ncbi:MAG: hypothetical protein FJ314_05455 [SAR202 cluster bacterium]|nr:hypothetical protein [SAR202 cluster bacterium]